MVARVKPLLVELEGTLYTHTHTHILTHTGRAQNKDINSDNDNVY